MEEARINRLFVIGGSAGSLDVILNIATVLPAEARSTFVIIVHRKAGPDSLLTALLASRATLPVKEVEDKEPILPGNIYLAPPDYHLLFENEHLFSLDCSEKLHFSRPSIDITFESAAEVFGERVTGILLSGANEDGSEGLCSIQQAKGITIAQDPASAEVGFMPKHAVDKNCAKYVFTPGEIARYIKENA